jgi:hypothetical protein
MSLSHINKRIYETVSTVVELVKGDGYHYFVYDDGEIYETESVMVPWTNLYKLSEWLLMAEKFNAKYFNHN